MNDLNEHLTREADQFVRRGGTELDLAQVLDRAGEIRRGRRLRATLVMAACVLAIAVPTIVVAADHGSPGHRTPDRPTPAHEVKKDVSPLELTGLDQGRPPAGGYAQDSVIHTDGTADVTAKGAVRALVQFGSRFLVETDIGEGELRVSLV